MIRTWVIRIGKREFAWEFSQLSCPVQTRTRVAWELTRYYPSKNSHQNLTGLINSHPALPTLNPKHPLWPPILTPTLVTLYRYFVKVILKVLPNQLKLTCCSCQQACTSKVWVRANRTNHKMRRSREPIVQRLSTSNVERVTLTWEQVE
jgi:hypothetical protein